MDSHNQENHLKKYDEKSLDKLQSRTVFADPTYGFIFKKTEKIIAALYLVTNLISDNEPIKIQLRKASLGLLSDTLSLRRTSSAQSRQSILNLMTVISEILSLLKIASVTEQISSMNYSIIHREIVMLMGNLDALHPEMVGNGSMVLPQDFFNVPTPSAVPTYSPATNVFQVGNAQAPSSKGQYRTPDAIKDSQIRSTPKDNVKDNRREKMLQLLKVGKPLSIRDFAQEIKNCSEKTIQRELLAMVESGTLKKTGERRWSVYSLVQPQ
ncbi:TPA: hypothetical protein DCQ44_01245 [Candidatus Taylorbacteria bacterium]|nr:hypothetical protein [Candidatus Taylorbacteria bacterium]